MPDKNTNTSTTSTIATNNATNITLPIDLSSIDMSLVSLSVTEGKYRMVRRILHNAGHTVLELRRLQYGNVVLGDLPLGQVRTCTADETAWARSLMR